MRLIDADTFDKCLLGAEIEATKSQKYVFSSAINTIRGNLANFPTVNQWIPVSERLPVICEYDVNGQKTFSCRVLSTQVYGNGLVFVGSDRYTSDRGWLSEVLDENGVPESKVIAWMPLPDPWKEEE